MSDFEALLDRAAAKTIAIGRERQRYGAYYEQMRVYGAAPLIVDEVHYMTGLFPWQRKILDEMKQHIEKGGKP